MCLAVNSLKPKVARKDIISYKNVVKINGRYYTPWQFMEVETGVEYVEEGFGHLDPYFADKGFHTFVNIKSAKYYQLDYGWRIIPVSGIGIQEGEAVVLKATTPKGSKFWEGTFFDANAMCSEKIKYEEI